MLYNSLWQADGCCYERIPQNIVSGPIKLLYFEKQRRSLTFKCQAECTCALVTFSYTYEGSKNILYEECCEMVF